MTASGKGFFLPVTKINTQKEKYMKGKSSYCVQDTSGISKTILEHGKYDFWITAKITERGIAPLGASHPLMVTAGILSVVLVTLGQALIPFPNSLVLLPAFGQAL